MIASNFDLFFCFRIRSTQGHTRQPCSIAPVISDIGKAEPEKVDSVHRGSSSMMPVDHSSILKASASSSSSSSSSSSTPPSSYLSALAKRKAPPNHSQNFQHHPVVTIALDVTLLLELVINE
jgi:hypothetical protein